MHLFSTRNLCLLISALWGLQLGFSQMGTVTKSKVLSDSIHLSTRLVLPEQPLKRKPPVIVVVHGAGKHGNWSTYWPMVKRFTEQGIAVVYFDKRGTGDSGGTYAEVSVENSIEVFESLSNDVVAVANWTSQQARIDSSKIGVLGYSEGGWVAPLAAVKSPHVKFAVMISGPLCTVGQEFLFSELTDTKLFPDEMPLDSVHAKMSDFEGEQGFDPEPVLCELNIPATWFFGAEDTSMAVAYSELKFKELLEKYPDKPFKYRIYENAKHSLYDATTRERKPYGLAVRNWLLTELYKE